MNDIEQILARNGSLFVHRNRAEEALQNLWKYGVEPIRDQTLRSALISFLIEKVPPMFYTGAATRSGKNHPPWHNGVCGIVINTWECCRFVQALAPSFPEMLLPDRTVDPESLDVALAATIISDSFKWSPDGNWNSKQHLPLAIEAWCEHVKSLGLHTNALAARTWNAVRWHHGPASPDWNPRVRFSAECHLVHLADMVMAQNFHSAPLRSE